MAPLAGFGAAGAGACVGAGSIAGDGVGAGCVCACAALTSPDPAPNMLTNTIINAAIKPAKNRALSLLLAAAIIESAPKLSIVQNVWREGTGRADAWCAMMRSR